MLRKHTLQKTLLATLLSGVFICAPAFSANKENLVKAAFIYNFTKFVQWPEAATNLNLCLRASPEFSAAVKEIESRSNNVLHYTVRTGFSSESCQLKIYEETPAAIPLQQNILTIGNGEDFVTKGGIIAFVTENDKVRFFVNLKAAEAAGLKIDAQLLEVAAKVIRP